MPTGCQPSKCEASWQLLCVCPSQGLQRDVGKCGNGDPISPSSPGSGQARQRGDAAGRTRHRQGELGWQAQNQRVHKGVTAAGNAETSLPRRNSTFNLISAAHVRKKTGLKSGIQPGQSVPYRAWNWLRERQQLARSFCFISLFWVIFG